MWFSLHYVHIHIMIWLASHVICLLCTKEQFLRKNIVYTKNSETQHLNSKYTICKINQHLFLYMYALSHYIHKDTTKRKHYASVNSLKNHAQCLQLVSRLNLTFSISFRCWPTFQICFFFNVLSIPIIFLLKKYCNGKKCCNGPAVKQ